MPNNPLDTQLLDRAIITAVKAHANTERRGKGFPYIVHPMEAVEIVATMTADQELLAAAALHDVVEDTDMTVEQIRQEFGDRVACLVAAESDTMPVGISETDSWRMRKQAAIDRLAAASLDAKIVAMGDKLSNMRAIYRDYMVKGDDLWSIFHAPNGKPDHEWHYRGLARSLNELTGTFAYTEFVELLNRVFGDPDFEQIDLADYEEVGSGFTAVTYIHRDGNTMIKMYGDFIAPEVPLTELMTSWRIANLGLNIPKAYRLVTDGKYCGVEFQRIDNKQSFARAISNSPERLEEYAIQFARETKRLHSLRCDTAVFPDICKRFIDIVDRVKLFDETQKQKVRDFIESTPKTQTCCHGDLHIGNLLTADGQHYWIDLADFAYGNPLFDLGMMCVTANLPDGLIRHLYHISKAQMGRVWNIFIKEYYGVTTDDEVEKHSDLIRKYASLYMLRFSLNSTMEPFMEQFIRDNLLN